MDPTLIIILLVMLGFFWLMSVSAKKMQKKQLEQQRASVVIGNNVVTTSGFFGRIVDIDGDAVTLESPAGDETVWLKRSIMAQMDIPFAEISEAEALAADEDNSQVTDSDLKSDLESAEQTQSLTQSDQDSFSGSVSDQPK